MNKRRNKTGKCYNFILLSDGIGHGKERHEPSLARVHGDVQHEARPGRADGDLSTDD